MQNTKQYRVKCLSVNSSKTNKIYRCGQIVLEHWFKEGEADAMVESKHLELLTVPDAQAAAELSAPNTIITTEVVLPPKEDDETGSETETENQSETSETQAPVTPAVDKKATKTQTKKK